jgi:putative ABC transport system ATP-binding protein
MNDRTDGRGAHIYELIDVHKHFGSGTSLVRALDGVELTVADGEFLAVQGPTGQGKSTLLTLLGGLDRPTSGEIIFDGQTLQTLGEADMAHLRAHAFGFVFQTFNLIPTLTAQENVETALVPLAVAANDRRDRAMETLGQFGLADRAHHLPNELSGGQQQRVAIARALVKDPRVLLADEPTGNLDEHTRDEIFGLLEGLWRNRGLTLVVVTHDSTIARRAQRIATIRAGRVHYGSGPVNSAATAAGLPNHQLRPSERVA